MSDYVANEALTKELTKRFKLLEQANQHMAMQNYGIARKLICKVLNDPMDIAVIQE